MRKSPSSNALLESHGTSSGGIGGNSSESYSSNSSQFSDSYSNSSDLVNWEEHVTADGSLFYAEYFRRSKIVATQLPDRIDFSRSSSLRAEKKTTSSSSKRSNIAAAKKIQQQKQQEHQSQCKFSIIKSSSNYKELDLVITAADRYRFGRRSSAIESILGFRVVAFKDQPECLMVASFVHDMPAIQKGQEQQAIKRGDWFKSLDNIEVRATNIDDLLLQFVQPTKVTLKFQGPPENPVDVSGAESIGDCKKIENFEMFSKAFGQFYENSNSEVSFHDDRSAEADECLHFAFLIVPLELSSDNSNQSVFYYPEDQDRNFLYKARGSFSTLNAVLTEELKSQPILSKLVVKGVEYFVNYRTLNRLLTVCAFSALVQTQKEASLRTDELLRYLKFTYPNMYLPLGDIHQSTIRKTLLGSCEIARWRVKPPGPRQYLFEELLKESRQMALPKEAQLRIFDALSEMEAMDYRNWNDEPLNTYREFFIFGSVLYYDCYLLASQLPIEIRLGLESFLRCRGIFDFVTLQNVKEFYVWQEIILPNATGRYFLTICCRGHLLLAVILKTYDAPPTAISETIAVIPPSLFYIEEIQETLDHLIQCGIESLATFWSLSNKRPEIEMLANAQNVEKAASDLPSCEKGHRKPETLIRQKSSSSLTVAAGSSSTSQRRRSMSYDEDIHVCSSLGGSSVHSLTPSEDDSSKRRGGVASGGAGGDSDSASDWEGFANQSNILHASGEGIPQMTESLWKEINNVVPAKLSAGWKNSLFYYIYVDSSNGTILCPLKSNRETFEFLGEMRRACYLIHDVLQESKKIRQTSQDPSKTSINNGMVAVKEHGVLIGVRNDSENSSTISGEFMVVGRLFFSPTKEVYVCHRPDIPQNMVEMAFRLSFLGVG